MISNPLKKLLTSLENNYQIPSTELSQYQYCKQDLIELTDNQLTSLVKLVITIYYSQHIHDRNYLDWISTLFHEHGKLEQLNLFLKNNLLIVLFNSFTHYFLYQGNNQLAEQSLQKVVKIKYPDSPSDIILTSIAFNNKAVLELNKHNYLNAYNIALKQIPRLEDHMQTLKSECSKTEQYESIVLINSYLICCQALDLYLNQKHPNVKQQNHYQSKLSQLYYQGSNMSISYLGQESVMTHAFRKIKTPRIPFQIPIVKVTIPKEDLPTQSSQYMQNMIRTMEIKIEHIQQIVVINDSAEPSISAILPKKSISSVNPSLKNQQLIKHINSFDEINVFQPLQINYPQSPAASQVVPIEFGFHKKQIEQAVFNYLPKTPIKQSQIIKQSFYKQSIQQLIKNQPLKQTPSQIIHPFLGPMSSPIHNVIQNLIPVPKSNPVSNLTSNRESNLCNSFIEMIEDVRSPKAQQKIKYIQITFKEFELGFTIVANIYESKNVQIFLIKNEQQLYNLQISQLDIPQYTSKTFAAPYPLDSNNINLEQIVTFYIVPYLQIQQQKLIISLFPKSIIPQQIMSFLNKQVKVIVCHIQLNQFRIILTQIDKQESFVFQLFMNDQQADDKISNYVENMNTHARIKNITSKYNRFKVSKATMEVTLNHPTFKKIDKFIQQVAQSIFLISQFLIKEELQNKKDLLILYKLQQFKQRSSITCIFEENQKYILRLENHLKFPQQTIKMRDKIELTYQQVSEQLGDFIVLPSKGQKMYLKSLIANHFQLRKIRKDFVEEDHKLYSKNPLYKNLSFLKIGFKRIISYDSNSSQYSIITISLICDFQNNPIGIKINIYFPNQTKSKNIFLPLSKYLWVKERKTLQNSKSKLKMSQAQRRRLKKKMFLNEFPVITNYNTSHVMTKGGFQEILDNLNIINGNVQKTDIVTSRVQNLLLQHFL